MTTRNKEAAAANPIVHPTLGFGVPATSNPHHFIVEIPRNNTGTVSIVENLGLQSHDQTQSLIARVILERPRWTAIRSEVQRAFNVIGQVLGQMERNSVILTMPKFEFESNIGLKDTLTQMGMGIAFSDSADFSGMDGRRDLLIQDVLHKAFVSVNEEGTEAAAATAVVVGLTSMPVDQKVVTMDRPFIFFIRDIQTNSIVFLGRVLNPAI